MVVVKQRSRTPSPTGTVTHDTVKNATIVPKRNKRRSMSVSDVDLKRAMAAASTATPLPRSSLSRESEDGAGWGSTLNGIITDFSGDLFRFDPVSDTLLDLKDPSTPQRKRPTAPRSQSENLSSFSPTRPAPKHSASTPVGPSVTIEPASSSDWYPSPDPSRATPNRSRSGSAANTPSRAPGLRYGPRSPQSRAAVTTSTYIPSPVRDNNRLRVQHRSSASSSEPSLVPPREEKRQCTRLRPVWLMRH